MQEKLLKVKTSVKNITRNRKTSGKTVDSFFYETVNVAKAKMS